eukprot:UN08648
MFDYIRSDVQKGNVLIDGTQANDGTIPLVKEKYKTERNRAKIMNFAIAYGKGPFTLSKDLGVNQDNAKEIIKKWYEARPEVKIWQEDTRRQSVKEGRVYTPFLARFRPIFYTPDHAVHDDKIVLEP